MLFDDLTCSGSKLQRVGIANEKPEVPASALTLGTDIKWKPDERSSLDLSARK